MKKVKTEKTKKKQIVLLEDLAPRKEVKGGAAKIVFGQSVGSFPPTGEKDQKK
jgi:hypothetical protein